MSKRTLREEERRQLQEIILQKRTEIRNSKPYKKFCTDEAELTALMERFEALTPSEQSKIKCKRDARAVLKRAPNRYWVLAEENDDSVLGAIFEKNSSELAKIISDLARIKYGFSQGYYVQSIHDVICGLKYRLDHLNDASPFGIDPNACRGHIHSPQHRSRSDI